MKGVERNPDSDLRASSATAIDDSSRKDCGLVIYETYDARVTH